MFLTWIESSFPVGVRPPNILSSGVGGGRFLWGDCPFIMSQYIYNPCPSFFFMFFFAKAETERPALHYP